MQFYSYMDTQNFLQESIYNRILSVCWKHAGAKGNRKYENLQTFQ